MEAVVAIGCGLLGVIVGAYVNVLIDRIPGTASLWPPRITCEQCSGETRGVATVATLARIRGASISTCADCGADQGRGQHRRRLAVELITAALYVAAALRFEATWVLVPFLFLFPVLVAFSVIDFRVHRLPDRLMFPSYVISLAAIVVVSVIEDAPRSIGYALIGAVCYFTFLLIPHLLRPDGMAFGDVKLVGLLGLYLGWLACSAFAAVYAVLLTMVGSAFLGMIMGVILTRRHLGRGSGQVPFAFGPALAVGAVLALLFYEQLPLDPFC